MTRTELKNQPQNFVVLLGSVLCELPCRVFSVDFEHSQIPGHSWTETRAKTAQTVAYSENYMSFKKVANRQDSWIMYRQLWESCEKNKR